MKLLLDENLSRRLIPFLQNESGSKQIALLGMERASDRDVLEYAKAHGFTIVTRDSDYYDFSTIYGQAPKVIWLRTGNQTKTTTLSTLLNGCEIIEKVLMVEQKACLQIYG
jgi:predicted nuclease of predicted toxin-antitoxin system